ncbi:MAG TPA: helix-turn-helix domain-containing protein [Thermoanaerobaculia bacterium]|nr:helix-turn-helix domain-containing protein [Thermoanaerobaculia bacterium]
MGTPKRQPPWDKPPEAETTAAFGDWLRRQREMREISLRDIADRTKISLRYLQAMEDDRFDLLPAPIFAKGFLREYARYVGLSPDDVVNHYLSVQQKGTSEEEGVRKDSTLAGQRPTRPRPVRNWTYGLFLALAVLLLIGLVAALAWYAERRRDDPAADVTPPPIAAPPAPETAPVAAPLPTPEKPKAPLEVTLDLTSACWVEVSADGKRIVAQEYAQGESQTFEAQQSVQITLGDTSAADIQVNGLSYPLNGKPGEVREFVIDLETVRQIAAKKEAP